MTRDAQSSTSFGLCPASIGMNLPWRTRSRCKAELCEPLSLPTDPTTFWNPWLPSDVPAARSGPGEPRADVFSSLPRPCHATLVGMSLFRESVDPLDDLSIDTAHALEPFKTDVWRKLPPAERLRRSWRLYSRLVDPQAAHDRKLFPTP